MWPDGWRWEKQKAIKWWFPKRAMISLFHTTENEVRCKELDECVGLGNRGLCRNSARGVLVKGGVWVQADIMMQRQDDGGNDWHQRKVCTALRCIKPGLLCSVRWRFGVNVRGAGDDPSLSRLTGVKAKCSTKKTLRSVLCCPLYSLRWQMNSHWDFVSEIIVDIEKGNVYFYSLFSFHKYK